MTVSNDWRPRTTSFASSSSTGDSLTSIVLSIRPGGASSGALPSNRSNRAPVAGRRARLTGSNLDHSFFVKSILFLLCIALNPFIHFLKLNQKWLEHARIVKSKDESKTSVQGFFIVFNSKFNKKRAHTAEKSF